MAAVSWGLGNEIRYRGGAGLRDPVFRKRSKGTLFIYDA
jgi:hypothetical protein